MKKFRYILTLFVGALVLNACESELEQVIISEDPVDPALTVAQGENPFDFTKEDAANPITLTWEAADFGFDASVSYAVQIATDETFETVADIIVTQELTGSTTVGDVNAILLSWELAIGEEAPLKCRVVATISDNLDPQYSPVLDLTATPYETLIDYPVLYLPGAYQGWAPDADNAANLYSYNFDNAYEGIVYFSEAGEFKITDGPSWDVNYGGSGGTLEQNGPNLSVAAAGAYLIQADLGALTYSITSTDHWGVIGSSVAPYDWSADMDMTYNGQRQMWEITADFEAGEFKFRANDGWDLNLGDNDADGSLEGGGANIAIGSDGNYTIRLDVNNSTYTVILN